jgi:hypothetical protein
MKPQDILISAADRVFADKNTSDGNTYMFAADVIAAAYWHIENPERLDKKCETVLALERYRSQYGWVFEWHRKLRKGLSLARW